jgi:DNA invertase Pin-like site-specific DNA recombinase
MIYGYLRVSSDEQDVNSQRQGVEQFATDHGWRIDNYITDEGVSGGKDPDKRNLGPLLKQIKKGDVIICSEISRLGRDLYMVMDILHFCMEQGCIIYTVKDKFVLGDDIQSKVLAFAFGLSAEIERQMIRQRTKEGLRLRMKMGVLCGRPMGSLSESVKLDAVKEKVIEQFRWGVPIRRIAVNFDVDRNTIARTLGRWGVVETKEWIKGEREYRREQNRRYKDENYKVVNIDRNKCRGLIFSDLTIPEIAEHFPEYSYEQIYDTILCDIEFNPLYRIHGQLKLKNKKRR